MEVDSKDSMSTSVEAEQESQVRDDPHKAVSAEKAPDLAQSQGPPGPIPNSKIAQDVTNRVLQFLSTASSEALVACVAALCICTYLILGRIGLVLLGVVGGVVLHASWISDGGEHNTEDKSKEARRRRDLGIAVAQRALSWRDSKKHEQEDVADEEEVSSDQKELGLNELRPATGAALKTLTDAVIRDYVKWWYGPILPSEEKFPISCEKTLVKFVLSVSAHLSRKRPADTFLDFLTNSASIIIVFLNELSAALMNPDALSQSPGHAVRQYLEENPESSLANVLSAQQQKRKLGLVADDLLKNFLETNAYKCEPVKVFLREILGGVVLQSSVTTIGRPEWINEWIIYLLEEGEPQILNAIDIEVDNATPNQLKVAASEPGDSSRQPEGKNVLNPTATDPGHRRRVNRAEDAMDQAMREAKRLSEMIAAEEAAKKQSHLRENSANASEASTATTMEGMVTPTSSESDRNGSEAHSPEKPKVTTEETTRPVPQPLTPKTEFTNFDQLTSWQPPTPPPVSSVPPTFTLQNASISIIDDSLPGEKAKPTTDFLLQIEPVSAQASGWMIPRKCQDFEALHEILRRIATISDATGFAQRYSVLPAWKGRTKSALREDLERYLQGALKYEALAESAGMKKFLEKERGLGKTTGPNKAAFGFPSQTAFENVGKGVLDVLETANKGVVGGGKAVLGGVTGVFGAVGGSGQKKPRAAPTPTRNRGESVSSISSGPGVRRESRDEFRPSTEISGAAYKPLPTPQQHPTIRVGEDGEASHDTGKTSPRSNRSTSELTRPRLDRLTTDEEQHLPPPPSVIADNYESEVLKLGKENTMPVGTPETPIGRDLPSHAEPKKDEDQVKRKVEEKTSTPLAEEETQMAIELFFAVIQELYTLSSAWNIRRTLLNAAKTFLLRPGNPNLESIRVLLQRSVIEANTTDAGIATHILKLRENTLPSEEELKKWPPPRTEDDRERLRLKARKLLVERGMPQALTSVMGAAASGEALGRVFDCLQIEEIARGFMFAILLQALRATTQ